MGTGYEKYLKIRVRKYRKGTEIGGEINKENS